MPCSFQQSTNTMWSTLPVVTSHCPPWTPHEQCLLVYWADAVQMSPPTWSLLLCARLCLKTTHPSHLAVGTRLLHSSKVCKLQCDYCFVYRPKKDLNFAVNEKSHAFFYELRISCTSVFKVLGNSPVKWLRQFLQILRTVMTFTPNFSHTRQTSTTRIQD